MKTWIATWIATAGFFVPAVLAAQLAIKTLPAEAVPTFDLAAAVEAALNPPNAQGFRTPRGVVQLPAGEITLYRPLNLFGAWGLKITGTGAGTTIVCDFNAPVAIDLRGAANCVLEDFTIRVPAARQIGAALFQARRVLTSVERDRGETVPHSAGFHRLVGLSIEGPTYGPAWVVAASECNTAIACKVTQYGSGPCLLVGNTAGSVSLVHGDSTMLQTSFYDCQFCIVSGADLSGGEAKPTSAANPVIRLAKRGAAAVGNIEFIGGGVGCNVVRPAVIQAEDLFAAGQLQNVHFSGFRIEAPLVDHVVVCLSDRPNGGDFTRFAFRDCTFESRKSAVFAPGQVLAGWVFDNVEAKIVTTLADQLDAADQPLPNPWLRQSSRPAIVGRVVSDGSGPPRLLIPTAANANQTYRFSTQVVEREEITP